MIGYRYSGRALAPRRRGGRRWKGVFMDKNEILEKSRKENQLHDEGVLHAQEKGRQWGVLGFLALCVAVQVYHLVLGLDNSLPMVFFWGMSPVKPWAGIGPGGKSICWWSAAWGRWECWPLESVM